MQSQLQWGYNEHNQTLRTMYLGRGLKSASIPLNKRQGNFNSPRLCEFNTTEREQYRAPRVVIN